MSDPVAHLAQVIREAAARKRPLCIRGGGTKDFYGGEPRGDPFSTAGLRGIVSYEPTELVITVRAGTPLSEIETAMREHGQLLAFEPPSFGENATLGGCVAAGLSGPRRPYAGAVRDFVLGVRILDGKGVDLRFGGQVMKNVAGYDVSRLMVGSLGTLGVLLEVSLKVLPLPAAEVTLRSEHTPAKAIALMNEWAGLPLPLSATCYSGNELYYRLSGTEAGVRAARAKLGGEQVPDGATFWTKVREQQLDFFRRPGELWRLAVRSSSPSLELPGEQCIEWGGALRWLKSGVDTARVRAAAAAAGGHATLFRGGDRSAGVFHPLPPTMMKLHRRLKQEFDPAGILNPGRMYPDL